MRVLIADDDIALATLLCRALQADAAEIEVVHAGDAALDSFLAHEPDLLILDLEMPGRSGAEVLQAVREASPLCPVLILSGIADVEVRVRCLEAGADDCLQKPFSLSELRARCRSILRRRQALGAILALHSGMPERAESATLSAGALVLDRLRRSVTLHGALLALTTREFILLEHLLLSAGEVVSRPALRQVFGQSQPSEANVVDVHLGALRRKLLASGDAPVIETVRGAGYRLLPAMPPPLARAQPGAGL